VCRKIVRNDFESIFVRLLKDGDADIIISQHFDRQTDFYWCHITFRLENDAEEIEKQTSWKVSEKRGEFSCLFAELSEDDIRRKLNEIGYNS